MSKEASKATFDLKGRGILGGLVSQSSRNTAEPEAVEAGAAKWIPVSQIQPGAYQPRQYFSESSIESLAKSFKAQGFRGAINVRAISGKRYEIVAGERRWRAAKQAGLTEVRCIVDDYSDEEALEFALVENLQREDLSKLEETEGILQLIETRLSIARNAAIQIIRTEGHSDQQARSDVAPSVELQNIEALLSHFNIELQTFRTKNLRTLTLPDDLKAAHLKNGLSYSSALELNKIKDGTKRAALLEQVIEKGLSFREVKQQVKEQATARSKVRRDSEARTLIQRMEVTLRRAKKSEKVLQQPRKRERLEQLLQELESLLDQ